MSLVTMSNVLLLFSSISFLFFGFSCLFSLYMKIEFKRYGLDKFRKTVGVLQLMGAIALLFGFYVAPIGLMGSLGLSLLMFLGVAVRIKIKDGLVKTMPALFYALLNLYLISIFV